MNLNINKNSEENIGEKKIFPTRCNFKKKTYVW